MLSNWGSWRLIVETFFVATAFLLVGAVRAWDDFDEGNAMTYLYIGGLVAADAALLILFVRTEASARAGDRHPSHRRVEPERDGSTITHPDH